MPLEIKSTRSGQFYVSGLQSAFAKYEKDIIAGKITCPFKVEFRASVILWRRARGWSSLTEVLEEVPEVVDRGSVVCSSPVPLTPKGIAKLLLF